MTARGRKSWMRTGCLWLLGLGLLVVLAIGGAFGLAALQNRGAVSETRSIEQPIPYERGIAEPALPLAGAHPAPPGRLELDLTVAQATLVPAPAGTPIRVEADFDPNRFELIEEQVKNHDGSWVMRIGIRPTGPVLWALFRVKIGRRAPLLRITVPRDQPLELSGKILDGYAAIELGGLRIRSADFTVQSGAVMMSFFEPLPEPMARLEVHGNGGAVEISHLGNASPREVRIFQHLGAVDLDFRGRWLNDAHIEVDTRAAGGTLWLPHDVRLEGVGEKGPWIPADTEIEPPTLHFDLPDRPNNLIVIY